MNTRLQSLMSRYLKCDVADITPEKSLESLGAKYSQIIRMATEFEAMFDVPMDADKALALKKVSDWEKLIEESLPR